MVLYLRQKNGHRVQVYNQKWGPEPIAERVFSTEEMRAYYRGLKKPDKITGAPNAPDPITVVVRCLITRMDLLVPMSKSGYEAWQSGIPLSVAEPGLDEATTALLEDQVSELGFAVAAGLFKEEVVEGVLAEPRPHVVVA